MGNTHDPTWGILLDLDTKEEQSSETTGSLLERKHDYTLNAIILAAGRGSRLGTLGDGVPKCLLKINGRTVLERLAESIELAGPVNNVFIVGGYRIETIKEHLPAGWVLLENDQYESTNSLYSLWLALQQLKDGDVAVFNSDVVYDPSLIRRFLNHPRDTACLVDELAEYTPGEFHVRVEDGMITEISSSVPASESFGVDAQVFKIASELLPFVRNTVNRLILAGESGHFAGKAIEVLAGRGFLHPVFTNGRIWSEFDTEEQFVRCQEEFSQLDDTPLQVEAYGIAGTNSDVSCDHNRQGRFKRVSTSVSRAFRRGLRCLQEWRLPILSASSRLVIAGIKKSPLRTIVLLWPLASSSLSLEGFRLQVFGHEMLAAVMEESNILGIRPFLLWGTLLGCVREGRFIRDDHDVDLGLLDLDFKRASELSDRMVNRGYSVRKQSEYKISFRHPTVGHLWIDIDRIQECSGNMWSTNTTGGQEYIFSYFFSRDIFADLKGQVFEGVDVLIPIGAEQFLEAVYGSWRVPQESKGYLRGPLNIRLQRKKDHAPNDTT